MDPVLVLVLVVAIISVVVVFAKMRPVASEWENERRRLAQADYMEARLEKAIRDGG